MFKLSVDDCLPLLEIDCTDYRIVKSPGGTIEMIEFYNGSIMILQVEVKKTT